MGVYKNLFERLEIAEKKKPGSQSSVWNVSTAERVINGYIKGKMRGMSLRTAYKAYMPKDISYASSALLVAEIKRARKAGFKTIKGYYGAGRPCSARARANKVLVKKGH